MASQSLYRKWRSQTFGDLVGQESVIRTLKNALNSNNLAHAYLFTGPRGTGKTSMARLLAKTINCPNSQNGEPCNVCDQCREITNGSSFNVLEIDAASNRGIDSIRELREKVAMPPTTGKYKVYILDEAHMLTTEAFNALLKTLEEPPAHAIFVMATTDVHKMLPTVLSRCQRFDFKRFSLRQLVDHLHYIAQQEQVELQTGAAELIARAASGGMRDALSLLDQAIAYSGSAITLEQVQAMLGVADPRAIQKFIGCIAALDSARGLHLIHELSEAGADLRQINTQVAEFWRAMMLARAGANIAEILDNTDDEMQDIVQTSKRFALEELTECARIFAQNELMQKGQGTPQLGLELAFLACVELHRRAQEGPALSAPVRPGFGPTNGATIQPRSAPVALPPTPPVRPEPTPQFFDEQPPEPAYSVEAFQVVEPTVPSVAEVHGTPPVSPMLLRTPTFSDTSSASVQIVEESVVLEAPAIITTADAPTLTLADVKEKWEDVRKRVKTRSDGFKIAALLGGYTILGVEGTSQQPIIVCKAAADFHYKTLQNDSYYETIRWALKIEMNMDCNIHLLAPNANVSISTLARPTSVPAANTMIEVPPQQSAHVERLAVSVAPPVSQQPAPVVRPVESVLVSPPPVPVQPREPTVRPAQAVAPVEKTDLPVAAGPPLARSGVVRENTNMTPAPNETHLDSIKKHAESNPVVTELVRMFKAEIKDIHPK